MQNSRKEKVAELHKEAVGFFQEKKFNDALMGFEVILNLQRKNFSL